MTDKERVEDLELELAEKQQDLQDALLVIMSALGLLGINLADLRSGKLELNTVLKGMKSVVFTAGADAEGFVAQIEPGIQRGQRLAAKYDQLIDQLTTHGA